MEANTDNHLMARYWGPNYEETDTVWLEQLARQEQERQNEQRTKEVPS